MSPQVRLGTCGYSYSWNEGKPSPFEWYVKQGFNSVEVNASFYRFPSQSWTKVWLRAPEDFDFSIKVHRSITHYRRLGRGSSELFERFQKALEPLMDRITHWLFQMPPSFAFSSKNMMRTTGLLNKLGLGSSAVLEFRHPSWWNHVEEVREAGPVFCSVDAPGLPRAMVNVNDGLYLRLHGRGVWYDYTYSDAELDTIADGVERSRVSRKHVYLNNDHGMLSNGYYLLGRFGLHPAV